MLEPRLRGLCARLASAESLAESQPPDLYHLTCVERDARNPNLQSLQSGVQMEHRWVSYPRARRSFEGLRLRFWGLGPSAASNAVVLRILVAWSLTVFRDNEFQCIYENICTWLLEFSWYCAFYTINSQVFEPSLAASTTESLLNQRGLIFKGLA